jgi:Methylamine utilisation protein MauE
MGVPMLAAVVSGLFAATAIRKLLHLSSFAIALAGFRIPARIALPASLGVIAIEGGGAVALLLAPGIGEMALVFLLVAATGLIVRDLLTGYAAHPCGCTGGVEEAGKLSWWLVARNLVLVVGLLVTGATLEPSLEALAGAALLGVAFLILFELVELRRSTQEWLGRGSYQAGGVHANRI